MVSTGGSSSFVLPDLSPYFPHLSADGKKMSEEEFSYYLFNLNEHTRKLKMAFAGLVFDLQKSLEQNKNCEDVVQCLEFINDNNVENLKDCTSISEVISKISKHFSFF